MTTNTRIRTIAEGVDAERIATETHIFYDPQTQGANIVFQGEEYLTANGEIIAKLEGRQALQVELQAIAAETFDAGTDPVTGTDLSQVSVAGVANLIRAVFDRKHNDAYRVS